MQYTLGDLHALIHSLSASEKRSFKIKHTSFTRKNNHNYLRLFDIINETKTYNKKDFDAILAKSKIKNYKIVVHRLFDMITKVLRSIHEKDIYEVRILGLLAEVDVLYKKGLPVQAGKRIEKTFMLAKKMDNPYLLGLVYNYKMKYFFSTKNKNPYNDFDKFLQQRQEHNIVIENTVDYLALAYKALYTLDEIGSGDALASMNYKKFLEHDLLRDKQKALTNYTKFQFHYIYAVYYIFFHDYKNFYLHNKQALDYAMKTNYIKKDNLKLITLQSNYINACILSKHFENAKATIAKLPNIASWSAAEKFAEFKGKHINQLDLFTVLKDTTGMTNKLKEIEQLLPLLKMNKQIGYVYMLKIATTYLHLKKYEKCMEWLNKLLNEDELTARKDVLVGCRLLYLVTHWEMGNLKLVEQYAISTYGYLQKKRKLHAFEKALLKFFSLAQEDESTRNKVSEWEYLLKILQADLTSISVKNDLFYFNYESWLKEKIAP